MSVNKPYQRSDELPSVIAVFPLTGALLLPRSELPLTIFEPRYLAMVDDALATHRIIGMIQPDDSSNDIKTNPALFSVGCAGRITQFAETGDGRYILSLSGIARFRIAEELLVTTPYRQCRIDMSPFLADFVPRAGENEVNRAEVLRTLREFAKANKLKIDWKSIQNTPNEPLVNELSMLSPFGPKEKQALLEAKDLKYRAEVLVAMTEIELARGNSSDQSLQ
jgi:Lon protease-like protein